MPEALNYRVRPHPGCPFKCLIIERIIWKHILPCVKKNSQWEFAVLLRELKPGLYDNLEGWDGEGRGGMFKWEGVTESKHILLAT